MRSSCFFALLVLSGCVPRGAALEPADVVVIANKAMSDSLAVAEHYRAKRGVPRENVIALDLPTGEEISRRDYDAKLVTPLRAKLGDRKERVKVLLCVYGVPLRVAEPELSDKDKAELKTVQADLAAIRDQLKKLRETAKQPATDTAAKDELKKAEQKERSLEGRRRFLSGSESQAAVDNELMLLWWENYELRRFIVNPLHFQYPAERRKGQQPVLMTARLDGPTPAIAKRLVDDAVEVEARGLAGKVYVDARDNRYDPKSDGGYGYGGYDESMREMARLLKDEAKMDVTLDNRSAVFPPGSCPECALYCGWYSHANFVDSNQFVKGAVAWHLASSEAVSLRRKDSKLWCPNILEKGACSTLGPVGEPYTVGFPKPAEFFGFLATGEFPLVECYARTLPVTSWMMTLIGDPLYNPFKASPRLKSERVLPSPKGGKFLLMAK
ncbi:MAG: TIGR03790 family protein [Gemmataceae bacterium]